MNDVFLISLIIIIVAQKYTKHFQTILHWTLCSFVELVLNFLYSMTWLLLQFTNTEQFAILYKCIIVKFQ